MFFLIHNLLSTGKILQENVNHTWLGRKQLQENQVKPESGDFTRQ